MRSGSRQVHTGGGGPDKAQHERTSMPSKHRSRLGKCTKMRSCPDDREAWTPSTRKVSLRCLALRCQPKQLS